MADELIAGLKEALGPFLSVSSLTDLYHAYKSIPTIYALVGHCLFCATLAPEFKHRFLLHFWVRDRRVVTTLPRGNRCDELNHAN